LCATLAVAAVPARANGDASRIDRAHAEFELGRQHFRLGDYAAAIRDFQAGYQLEPQPLFLYNIGLAEERAGHCARALASLNQYLDSNPAPAERADTERRMAEIHQRCVEKPEAPPLVAAPPSPVAAATPPAAPDRARFGARALIAGVTLGAIGVAAIASGAGLEARAMADNDAIAHPSPGATFDEGAQNQRDLFHPLGVTLLAVGGVALVSGAVLISLGTRARRSSAQSSR
jgi:tetratricopeptide (TPR) repeat protein